MSSGLLKKAHRGMGKRAAAGIEGCPGCRRRRHGTLTILATETPAMAASNMRKMAAASRFRFTAAAVR